MPLRENELARRDNAGIELRVPPLRIRWEFPDLVTRDGHELRCVFTAGVRAVPDRAERRMLEELLLDGRPAVFAEDVARHFMPALRGAATRIAQAHDARQWVEIDQPRLELIDALKAAALPVAFACGVEMLPPYSADFQSPTFERERVRALQQAQAEKQAAGQVENLHRASELLKQFQALRAQAPELSAGQILEQINPADRGSLMQSLLLAEARRQTGGTLWAVAGPYLVRVDVSRPIDGRQPPTPELFPMPPTLGPLRSVQAEEIDGRPMLLIGAQRGFLLVDARDFSRVTAFADPGSDSPLGFNRVIYWPRREQFVATHSEAGIVSWDRRSPDAPVSAIRSAALGVAPAAIPELPPSNSIGASMRVGGGPMGPRNLRVLDADALVFSAGGRIMLWDGGAAQTLAHANDSEAIGIWPLDDRLETLHEDGTFCEIDYRSRKVVACNRRFGRIRAAAALPWLGSWRLLLAGDDGPVQCVGLSDPLITQYYSSHRGLRVLAGSASLIGAISPDRQRVVLWNSWDGRQPAAELFISALARHRIAQIFFA
ncbi:MAG TPA: hypothetical protein VG326_19865 [Tepidisphaeraceae bacterium]|jgi:hypothetical protein|nr:hypothetical protein [Tepidisphaeraceae bacterium]